ncbi:MAG: ABC transporter permease [Deltaproteobacteria bacterium]|nr:ABC transporter permease [Deltaproteobacteria bacterium]
MVQFVIKRLFLGIVVLWVLITLTFFILRFLPGGPFDSDKKLPPQVLQNLQKKYRLDLSLEKQYFFYLKDLVFHFDLGPSFKNPDRSINEMIAVSFPISLQLGMCALLIAFLVGIPLGLLAAYHHNTKWDHIFMICAISGVSLPAFLSGSILILIFSKFLSLLPAARWDGLSYMILPALTLGLRPAAIIARLMRGSALEVMDSDYIRTARAKGLSESQVVYKHVLKNSVLPVLTLAGPLSASIITGSFIVELIFAIPGMADYFVDAVFNRDYTLIMGATIVYAFFLISANILVDVLYRFIDSRMQVT